MTDMEDRNPGDKVTLSGVREVVPELDDVDAAAIVALGPTWAEFAEAYLHARGDSDQAARAGRAPTGVVAEIIEILAEKEEQEENGR